MPSATARFPRERPGKGPETALTANPTAPRGCRAPLRQRRAAGTMPREAHSKPFYSAPQLLRPSLGSRGSWRGGSDMGLPPPARTAIRLARPRPEPLGRKARRDLALPAVAPPASLRPSDARRAAQRAILRDCEPFLVCCWWSFICDSHAERRKARRGCSENCRDYLPLPSVTGRDAASDRCAFGPMFMRSVARCNLWWRLVSEGP